MSAQAGIFYFDGRPIEPDVPTRLDAQLAEFGPDGSGQYVAPGLVMVHRALHVTPEDCLERQPHVSERGNVMTWDGRLDNREDLLLQLWRDLRDDATDVALATAAYETWGDQAFGRLIGDWSLAVWNARTRSLTLASDFAGIRPLYYHAVDRRLLWSTTLGGLLDQTDSRELDPRFLVGYLTFAGRPGATPYRDIRSISAGHSETWTSSGAVDRKSFWQPVAARIRYRDRDTYAEHLRSVFADAVHTRLRTRKPVWIELSGGLDSSSIACLAALLVRNTTANSGVSTISYTSDLVHQSDESLFIEAAEHQIGRPGRHVRIEDVFDLVDDDRSARTPLHPTGCNLAFLRIVRESGSHVLLSGSPGDLVMGNSVNACSAVLEDFADAAPLRALANLHEWSRSSQEPIWVLAWRILLELGPRSLLTRRYVGETLRRHGQVASREVATAARDLFLLTDRGVELWRENLRGWLQATLRSENPAKRSLIQGLLASIRGRVLESPSEFSGVLRSYPYMHRPLVDFALAIPLGHLCRPGEPRALMREAFAAFLPSRILARRSKGYIAPFYHRAIGRVVPDLKRRVETLHLVRAGIVDPGRLRTKLETIQHGSSRDAGNLVNIVRFERWMDMPMIRTSARSLIST